MFDIEDLGRGAAKRAVVARPRDCSVCRECIRLDGWADKVRLTRVPDHFIFKVESVGMLSPREVVVEAIRILKTKCTSFLAVLDGSDGGQVEADAADDGDDVADILS